MGVVSSIIQGFIFAAMNTAMLAYVGEKMQEEFTISLDLLPRLMVFHFCLCFVLGTIFAESVAAYIHPTHGPIVGPMGTFLATWIGLYVAQVASLMTQEYVILTPMVFAVAYAYGQAKHVNMVPSRYGPYLSSVVFMLALVVLLVKSEYIDEFVSEEMEYFGTWNSQVPQTYLAQEGGLFGSPFFAPVFVTLASYGLMWSQIPVGS